MLASVQICTRAKASKKGLDQILNKPCERQGSCTGAVMTFLEAVMSSLLFTLKAGPATTVASSSHSLEVPSEQ